MAVVVNNKLFIRFRLVLQTLLLLEEEVEEEAWSATT
jgi:hypothetical protein